MSQEYSFVASVFSTAAAPTGEAVPVDIYTLEQSVLLTEIRARLRQIVEWIRTNPVHQPYPLGLRKAFQKFMCSAYAAGFRPSRDRILPTRGISWTLWDGKKSAGSFDEVEWLENFVPPNSDSSFPEPPFRVSYPSTVLPPGCDVFGQIEDAFRPFVFVFPGELVYDNTGRLSLDEVGGRYRLVMYWCWGKPGPLFRGLCDVADKIDKGFFSIDIGYARHLLRTYEEFIKVCDSSCCLLGEIVAEMEKGGISKRDGVRDIRSGTITSFLSESVQRDEMLRNDLLIRFKHSA